MKCSLSAGKCCQICSCKLRFALLLGVLYCADIGESNFISVLHCPSSDSLLGSQRMFSYLQVKIPVLIDMYFFSPCHRRVAAFEAKQNQLKDQQKAAAKPPGRAGCRFQGLSKEDRAIAERLERLREERKPSEF